MGSAECLGCGSRGSWFSLSLIVLILLAGGKKKRDFYENVFPMFSGRQSNRFLSVDPFQSAALTLWNELPAMPLQPVAGPILSPAKCLSLIYLNFPGMTIQGQHLSWCLNICLSPSIWSSFQMLFSLISWIVFVVSDNEFMGKPIVRHVLYCLDRVTAVWCLFCPLKWGCLSLTFHLWGKCLQLLCQYVLEFYARKVLHVLQWLGYVWYVEWHQKWTQGWRMCPLFQL